MEKIKQKKIRTCLPVRTFLASPVRTCLPVRTFLASPVVFLPIELIVALSASIGALVTNRLFFGEGRVSLNQGIVWIIRYFAFGNGYFLWFAFFIYFAFFIKFYRAAVALLNHYFLRHSVASRQQIKRTLYLLWRPFYVLLPLSIIAGPFSTLLANISYAARFTTLDLLFFKLDAAVFGVNPFLVLPIWLPWDWLVFTLEQFYLSLSVGLSVMFGLLYYYSETLLFRQAVLAFILSLVIAYPFFVAFPCQAPSNFFIRNLRHYSFSQVREVQYVYRASPLTLDIITMFSQAETNSLKDNAVPVSCFPSMHAVWAYFIIYFLYCLFKRSLSITLPWAVLLLTGGLYFAQHYAIDYLAAFPVAFVCIALAKLLLRLEHSWQQKRSPQSL